MRDLYLIMIGVAGCMLILVLMASNSPNRYTQKQIESNDCYSFCKDRKSSVKEISIQVSPHVDPVIHCNPQMHRCSCMSDDGYKKTVCVIPEKE